MAEFPLPFWLAAGLVVGLGGFFLTKRHEGYGFPAAMVVATIGVWYLGDALYNDYAGYVKEFGPQVMDDAWWQVVVFLLTFAGAAKPLHNGINRKLLGQRSRICALMETNFLENSGLQEKISQAARVLIGAWVVLMTVALIRVDWNFQGLFLPFLGGEVSPWGRGRMGGPLDALISLASYVQIFLTAGAGLILALSKKPGTRTLALIMVILSFPQILFGRARNMMLAIVLPGLLTWTFFRLKGGILVKAAVLAGAFSLLNSWFTFVLEVRAGGSVAEAFARGEYGKVEKARAEERGTEFKHLGLNMLEELAWCDLLIQQGRYQPNWGSRYFAEIVNIIPRGLWKGKPTAGLDYAIARGLGGGEASEGGVLASVSTGMIGQGVANFGSLLGPMAAALIMAAWAALVARQDLLADDPGRILLYCVGMILTFNCGRDITLLTLYPFFFGWMLLAWLDKRRAKTIKKETVGEPGKQAVRGSPLRMTREKIEEQRMKERAGG